MNERKRRAYLPLLAIGLVYTVGMFLDVMDIDEAQYASIGVEMMQNGSYLEVLHRGADYLDKPPLLFWVSAGAFKLLGASNFVYRLVPVLVCLLGIYATHRLAKLFYNDKVAYLSALMLASAYGVFLMNHDLRTDTMLMGWTIFAIWQLAEHVQSGRWRHLLLGSVGVGLAMLAKGPIGLMLPVLAFGTHFVLTRQFGRIFRWQWLAGLGVVALVLAPMCVGLYRQFDLHPEKVIEGQQNTSGLYFFFWKQSFGRLTGENVWQDDSDPFFFVHTYLWTALPWGLLAYFALYDLAKNAVRHWRGKAAPYPFFRQPEFLSLGGFVLPFVALSMSHYKLPHYINIVLPLGAIFSARYVYLLIYDPAYATLRKFMAGVQWLNVSVIWLVALLGAGWAFAPASPLVWAGAGVALALTFYLGLRGQTRFQRLIMPSVVAITGAYWVLNSHCYPALLQYQTGSVLGHYLRQQTDFPLARFFALHRETGDGKDIFVHTIDFYTERITPLHERARELAEAIGNEPAWVYLDATGLAELRQFGKVEVLRSYDKFHVTQLNGTFLDPATRLQATTKVYLVAFVPDLRGVAARGRLPQGLTKGLIVNKQSFQSLKIKL
jgi:4-amino-4-deoxy-L-arabinose transferase-like glycosyltransferase